MQRGGAWGKWSPLFFLIWTVNSKVRPWIEGYDRLLYPWERGQEGRPPSAWRRSACINQSPLGIWLRLQRSRPCCECRATTQHGAWRCRRRVTWCERIWRSGWVRAFSWPVSWPNQASSCGLSIGQSHPAHPRSTPGCRYQISDQDKNI